jgi:hypothetical protein
VTTVWIGALPRMYKWAHEKMLNLISHLMRLIKTIWHRFIPTRIATTSEWLRMWRKQNSRKLFWECKMVCPR